MSPFDNSAASVFDSVQKQGFYLVKPTDEAIITQLISEKAEKVHPFPEDLETFIDYRVGGLSQSRQTWVRLNKGGEVTGALYSQRSNTPLVSLVDLHGKVDDTLSTPKCDLDKRVPGSFIFYSIAAFGRGEGAKLISSVHGFLSNHWSTAPTLSTLSPLRGAKGSNQSDPAVSFKGWLQGRFKDSVIDQLRPDQERLKHEVLTYLGENINGVQRFHMGNGAIIGDIKFNANATGTLDDEHALGVMVNYGYPSVGKLVSNRELYKAGQVSTSSHLLNQARRTPYTPRLVNAA